MSSKALVTLPHEANELTVAQLKGQVTKIQEVMRSVMKEDVHYGSVPGIPQKFLFKAGAEKLCMTFRLIPHYTIDKTVHDRGHLSYDITCTLTHQPSGSVVGEGVGSASTLEKKYRYRNEDLPTGVEVPSAWWRTRDKDNLPLILKNNGVTPKTAAAMKKEGLELNTGKVNGKFQIVYRKRVENKDIADLYNCVTSDTRVLTQDLRWLPAGEVVTGDKLLGVEEYGRKYGRNFAVGEAQVYGRREDTIYQIRFEDGRTVKCNGEHKWLVSKIGQKGTEWVETEYIYKTLKDGTKGRPRDWKVISVSAPWEEDLSKTAGYVAGAMDADGTLATQNITVMFAQQDNAVLNIVETLLKEKGFTTGRGDCSSPISAEPVYNVRVLGGLPEQMRFLGSIRPARLVDRWLHKIDITKRRVEARGIGSGAGKRVAIDSIDKIEDGEVVLLGTTCKTYIAEGFVCHNTAIKMAKKRALVDATITALAVGDMFSQDPEVVTGNDDEEERQEKEAKPAGSKSTSNSRRKTTNAKRNTRANTKKD